MKNIDKYKIIEPTEGLRKTEEEKKRLIDSLINFAQYEAIPYAADFMCPNCGKSGMFGGMFYYKLEKPKLVGYCSTNIGYMAVFECPACFEKFRFHPQMNKFDWDDFVESLYLNNDSYEIDK